MRWRNLDGLVASVVEGNLNHGEHGRFATGSDRVLPALHSNGTKKQELINPLSDAYDAVQNAMDVLKKAAPNARDYNGFAEHEKAADQHYARQKALQDVSDELEKHIHAIDALKG